MTNNEIIKCWVGGIKEATAGNRKIIDYKLYSYRTIIAEWNQDKTEALVNVTKYSSTTTRCQNEVIAALEAKNIPYETIDNIAQGKQTLTTK